MRIKVTRNKEDKTKLTLCIKTSSVDLALLTKRKSARHCHNNNIIRFLITVTGNQISLK